MNKKILLLVVFCLSLFSSCSHDSDDIISGCEHDTTFGFMISGDGILSLNLYSVSLGQTYRPGTEAIVTDYASFQLLGLVKYATLYNLDARYKKYTNEQKCAMYDLEEKYWKNRSSFILDAFIEANGGLEWPWFFTAYIDGDVTIECDKVLFGKEPGTDLSPYFRVKGKNSCLAIGRENPYMLYGFFDEKPTNMEEYLQKDTWLQATYMFYFDEVPQEKYDELTFTVTIPITREHVTKYITAQYLGKDEALKVTNDTCRSTCTVKCNFTETEQ